MIMCELELQMHVMMENSKDFSQIISLKEWKD